MPEAGDPLKDVQTGERLVIRAPTWNLHNAAAREYLRHRHDRGQRPRRRDWQRSVVLMKNVSGYDCARGDVLGIKEAIFDDVGALTLGQYQNTIALKGETPDKAKHFGRFAILVEPIADGAIGHVCVTGVCAASISSDDWDPAYDVWRADIKDGDRSLLAPNPAGAAQILSAVEIETGTRWCLVALRDPRPWIDHGYDVWASPGFILDPSAAQKIDTVDPIVYTGHGWSYSHASKEFTCQQPGRYRFGFSATVTPYPPRPTLDEAPTPKRIDSDPRTAKLWLTVNGGLMGMPAYFGAETIEVSRTGYIFFSYDFDANDTVACWLQIIGGQAGETAYLVAAAYELMQMP